MKFDGLTASDAGLAYEKIHETIPYEDKYYSVTQFYIDISRVESLEFCKPYKDRASCNINTYSGDTFTVLFDMDTLAIIIKKSRQDKLIMNYAN